MQEGASTPDIATRILPTTEELPRGLPMPPRRIRRPWQKLAKKISKIVKNPVPPMVLPILVAFAVERRRRFRRLTAREAMEAMGIGQEMLGSLIRLGLLTIEEYKESKHKHVVIDPNEVTSTHVLNMRWDIRSSLLRHQKEASNTIKWFAENYQEPLIILP